MLTGIGSVGTTQRIFDGLVLRVTLSWDSPISGYVKNARSDSAFHLFQEMDISLSPSLLDLGGIWRLASAVATSTPPLPVARTSEEPLPATTAPPTRSARGSAISPDAAIAWGLGPTAAAPSVAEVLSSALYNKHNGHRLDVLVYCDPSAAAVTATWMMEATHARIDKAVTHG
ncbi:hypothetical protein GOP47_0026579 [Adiantum capillus-veneris]|nr:hypothetical protein GOP47_0026579 [Adiantum capillus-veneris]